MTTETVAFQMLPLSALLESPLNSRKTFNATALAELTASVKAKGVITPLLVRPNADGYEIAAGHRRYRAAKAAELEEVPAIVRPMADVDFLEVLVMENDEREDLHPLEEAEGYRTLMTKAGYSVERIAERKGCSVKYVYDRVKLLSLTKEAQRLFREEKFTAGHAILLARLAPADQKRALDPDGGGLWQDERLLWDPDRDEAVTDGPRKAVSVRELQAWIDEHVKFDLKAADPMLFDETVRTVSQAREDAEKVVQITHDHFVQPDARDDAERIISPRSWKRADGRHRSKLCATAVTGVIVVGPGRGEAFKVCIDKKRCKVHWAAEQRAAAKAARRAGSSRSEAADSWKAQQEKWEAERKRREAERARWEKALPQVLEAVAAAVKTAPTKATGLLAEVVLGAVGDPYRDKGNTKAAAYVPRGSTAEDLVRHAAFVALYHEAVDSRAFPRRAKAFGIDVRRIVDDAAPRAADQAASQRKARKRT